MKHKGNVCELNTDRADDLMRTWREIFLQAPPRTTCHQLLAELARRPARRFYVSEERALDVVTRISHGNAMQRMNHTRKEMYAEIHRRTVDLLRRTPGMTLREAVAKVVHGPAPHFYLTPKSMKVIFYRIRKKWLGGEA